MQYFLKKSKKINDEQILTFKIKTGSNSALAWLNLSHLTLIPAPAKDTGDEGVMAK